jgi:hypothetical protein
MMYRVRSNTDSRLWMTVSVRQTTPSLLAYSGK